MQQRKDSGTSRQQQDQQALHGPCSRRQSRRHRAAAAVQHRLRTAGQSWRRGPVQLGRPCGRQSRKITVERLMFHVEHPGKEVKPCVSGAAAAAAAAARAAAAAAVAAAATRAPAAAAAARAAAASAAASAAEKGPHRQRWGPWCVNHQKRAAHRGTNPHHQAGEAAPRRQT